MMVRKKEPNRIENVPSPVILVESLRSIGYSFNTAIADILDNSVSAGAKNIWINFTPNDDGNPYISILDDGCGMDDAELFNAMKYGSVRENYGKDDLGRFGLGLKSASLSQCRILTVLSKRDGVMSGYRWDIDDIIESESWGCIKLDDGDMAECPSRSVLSALESGTLVIWQNFDFAKQKSDDGNVYSYLSEKIYDCEKHICLIFHRFMNRCVSPVRIYVNDIELEGLDPFLEGTPHHERNPKVDIHKSMDIPVSYMENGERKEAKIKVQTCILPHNKDLTYEDEKFLGEGSLRDSQGFYLYRNDRLIVYGTWFNIPLNGVNKELYKYGRIKVDIPNTLDSMWEIDIKKQNAVVPHGIIKALKRSVSDVRAASRRKVEKRSVLSGDAKGGQLWVKKKSRDGGDSYSINIEAPFISRCLDSFGDKDKRTVIRMLDVISSQIPFYDIYVSECKDRRDPGPDDEMMDSLVSLCIEQFNDIRTKTRCTDEEAFKRLCGCPPISGDEKLIETLRGLILNG